MLMNRDYEQFQQTAELLKALGHPVRLCILKGLLDTGGCNVTHMTHCLALPQSTISQHLQKLKQAKIIEGERKGLEITYRVTSDLAKQIMTLMDL